MTSSRWTRRSLKAMCCLLHYVVQEEDILSHVGKARPDVIVLQSAFSVLRCKPVLNVTSCCPAGDSYVLATEIQCKILMCLMLLFCCRPDEITT